VTKSLAHIMSHQSSVVLGRTQVHLSLFSRESPCGPIRGNIAYVDVWAHERIAADDLKWAQSCCQDVLPTVSDGPSVVHMGHYQWP